LGAAAQHLEASAHAAARLETVTGAAPSIADPPLPAPLPAGAAALEDVSARFPGATGDVLRGVSLAVAPGRAVALVGPSGAGKTTVANLLARFLDPVAGRVTLGGADLRTGAQDDLRARVRLVEQDAHLFATSVRANVALARPGATDGEIAGALRAAGLGAWLEALPDGLATLVGEHGAQVSGGQRSRIAAARALLCDAEILVVDEPAAHLDPAGARELLHRLAAERDRGRGVLVISHATDGLDAFDEVVVLEDGRVAERGTHAALLARDGRYAGLASASASPSPSPA
ncbi:MAG TPA: ABC transporter ATP-binding protein, partial [Solirubrobacteraceae bacterium]|nr:ABC transporter ATP-binding protein [Solirubrobacteraceae bacterium]